MAIDFIQLLPCKKCGKTFERWEPVSECGGPEWGVWLLHEEVRNAVTEWDNFPDLIFFAESVKTVIGDANENEWVECELELNESPFYCPDCGLLTLRTEWRIWNRTIYQQNRPQVCECGSELFRIDDLSKLRELVIRCPDCGNELEVIGEYGRD